MTPGQLRAAFRRAFLANGTHDGADLIDELVAIADHHAAEEAAAAATDAA